MKAATVSEQTAPSGWRISIHAAREGGDMTTNYMCNEWLDISIHAAREGGDAARSILYPVRSNFNPRRP